MNWGQVENALAIESVSTMGNFKISGQTFSQQGVYYENYAFNNKGIVLNIQGFDGEISFVNNTVRNNMILDDAIYPFTYNTSSMSGLELTEMINSDSYSYSLYNCYEYLVGGYTSPYAEVDDSKS